MNCVRARPQEYCNQPLRLHKILISSGGDSEVGAMDVRQYERFADMIRAVRKQNGLSQREMARALNVSAGYVGQWELGLSKPSADVVKRICKTFGVDEVEYVLRLAFAESAPDFLREAI